MSGRPEARAGARRNHFRFRSFLRPYRVPLVIAVGVTLTQTMIALLQPWPLQLVVDHALGRRPLRGWMRPLAGLTPSDIAAVAAGALVAIAVFGALFGYLSSYLSGAGAERVGADLREAVHERLLILPMRFHDQNRSGELVSRLVGDVDRVQDALISSLTTLIPGALTLAGILTIMVLIDPVLSAAALAVLPVLAGVVVVRRRCIQVAQRRAREEEGRLAALATDTVRNVRAVQAFCHERTAQSRFQQQNLAAAGASIFALDLEARYSPIADIVLVFGTAFVLWFGVVRVLSGRITLGLLLVFFAYIGSLYSPVRSLSRLSRTWAKAAASRERIEQVMNEAKPLSEDPNPLEAAPPTQGLALCAMSFSYPGGAPVWRDLSVAVPAGQTLCLVGPSGVGKSTLLALLLRFYDPDEGSIELDGVDLRRYSLTSLRRQIALVPQDAWIVDGTIADNIAFGRPDASVADIERASAVALVDEFVERLPGGFATVVGESGALLSGGQRRRIALARAVLRNAPILLLDEPTSGLDPASEQTVIAAIRNAVIGRTVIMASHQLGVAAVADRVVVLGQGRIVEDGAPLALLANGREFARLWGIQRGLGLGHPPDTQDRRVAEVV
jgi:ATP-binding cassette subfamily B protein